jgi:transposase
MMKLSDTVIHERLQRLRNVEHAYEDQKVQLQTVRAENRELRLELSMVRAENTELKRTIQDMQLRVEELTAMVFGRKKKRDSDEDKDRSHPKTPRAPESYQRKIPTEDEITDQSSHPLNACAHCQGTLTKRTAVVYYEEDLPLPHRKIVIKHTIGKGYCTHCKKWSVGAPAPSAKVILGSRVQAYIVYLSVMARLSFSQIRHLLFDTCAFSVSDGEMVKILMRQSVVYGPEYERLKESIRSEPVVHLDETGWKQLNDGSRVYAWSMSTPLGKAVFLIGESRGKGNVKTLLGDHFHGTAVTDDYAAYDGIPEQDHQLCWSHPLRKFRDLAQSKEVGKTTKAHHMTMHQTLTTIFRSVREHRSLSFLAEHAQKLKDFARIDMQDCKKARTLKTTLVANIPKYLTCLTDPLIPLTNNQAERSLRHLVLKRKVSFGSHSKKTAHCLAVLLSVFMSRRSANPNGWFGKVLAGA